MQNIAIGIEELTKPNIIGNIGLNDYAFKLINDVDLILAMVVSNTLKYNKYTTIDEIFENQEVKNLDKYTIEYICEALAINNGVLIKLINGHKVSYKLNSQLYT